MEIFKEFRFEAAHRLTAVPPGHQCARLHGHSYRVRVFVRGKVDPRTGWIMDFADLKRVVQPVIDELDHQFLNEVPGIGNPGTTTSEQIAMILWRRIKPGLAGLSAVEVWETATSGARYAGEDEAPA